MVAKTTSVSGFHFRFEFLVLDFKRQTYRQSMWATFRCIGGQNSKIHNYLYRLRKLILAIFEILWQSWSAITSPGHKLAKSVFAKKNLKVFFYFEANFRYFANMPLPGANIFKMVRATPVTFSLLSRPLGQMYQ